MDHTILNNFGHTPKDDCVLTRQFAGDLRAEVMTDSIIPDTVADVEKILLTTATPKIEGYYVTDSGFEVEESVTYQTLLLTESGDLTTLTVTEPFTLKQEVALPSPDCQMILIPTLDYVTARLVNPRKLNLRSQTGVSARVFCCQSAKPDVSGTETLDDDLSLQRQIASVNTTAVLSTEDMNIPASHDVELDSNAPAAAEILLSRVALRPTEVRFRGNEADVRTEARLSLLYRTEEGNAFASEKTFLLERTVAVPTFENAEWLATAAPGAVNAQIAANAYGEMKVIELDFPYDLSLTALYGVDVDTVTDMYSTEFECDTAYRTLPIQKLHRMYTTNLTVNASSSRADLGGEAVRAVFDGFVTLKNGSVTYHEDTRKLIVEGTAEIAMLGENNAVEGSDPLYSPMTFSYPFRCELDAGSVPKEADFILDCALANTKFRADSSNLYADIELVIRVMAMDTSNVSCLETLHLDRTTPVTHREAPITLCYPSREETLWDIAKEYRMTEESIMLSNNMASDDISDRKVLLIPRAQPKKPMFSKVI